MKMSLLLTLSFVFVISCNSGTHKEVTEQEEKILKKQTEETVGSIPLPEGFRRVAVEKNSFGEYLRNLKLNKDKTVYDYAGNVVMTPENGYQYAVIDMDIGDRDLQQCADAVMRLRAEYLYKLKKYNEIHFNFYDGKAHYYTEYTGDDRSYQNFRKFMNYIFVYANTYTLRREMQKVPVEDMQIGDVFIRQGNPFGHAVIIVDMAENPQTGEKIFMVAQSFMPAQSIHIMKKSYDEASPWFSADFGEKIIFPSWSFYKEDLRRF